MPTSGQGSVTTMTGTPETKNGRVVCLRETEAHKEFLFLFAHTVVVTPNFKDIAAHKLLSEFITPSLEAFAVLTYVNNYEQWIENRMVASMAPEIQEKVTKTAKRKYTSLTRGTGKYSGWAPEGVRLYKDVWNRIKEQRANPDCIGFEYDVKNKFWEHRPGNEKGNSGEGGEDEEEDEDYSPTDFGLEDGVGIAQRGAVVRNTAVTPEYRRNTVSSIVLV